MSFLPETTILSLKGAIYYLRFALLRLFICLVIALGGLYLVAQDIFTASAVGLTLLALGSAYWVYLRRPHLK